MDDSETAARGEWQDIETAPKDGTVVLLAMTDHHRSIFAGWWTHERVMIPYWKTMSNWGRNLDREYQPTHWMPLPEPPAPRSGPDRG